MKTLVILLSLLLAAPAHTDAARSLPENTVTAQKKTVDQKKDKAARKNVSTVTFKSSMHCENCVKKLTDNLAYAKGVKDLDISLEENTITVKYDASKTSEEALAAIIKKLGYNAVSQSGE